jgi:2-methylisocitrate lyase-like PEP mutase family enzyme
VPVTHHSYRPIDPEGCLEVPATFRQLLTSNNDDMLVIPGCFDALSARLAEHLGFPATYLAGWTLGAVLGTGEPRTNLTDLLQRVQEIRRVTTIPAIVDGGAGYGDAGYTAHAVQLAGAGAIHIEDQVYPKRMEYLSGIEHLAALDEMLARLDAAVLGRGDGPMAIIGRTDAIRAAGSFDEAVKRANLFFDHGVDAVMAMAYQIEDVELFPKLVKGPLIYAFVEGLRPMLSAKDLQQLGYRVMIAPISALGEAYKATEKVYLSLRETGLPGTEADSGQAARVDIQELLGLI